LTHDIFHTATASLFVLITLKKDFEPFDFVYLETAVSYDPVDTRSASQKLLQEEEYNKCKTSSLKKLLTKH
jgi:hypothetical protein